jgi:hypothetical protein
MHVGHLQPVVRNDFTAQLVISDRPPGGWDGERIAGLFENVFAAQQIQGHLQIIFEPFDPDERPQRVVAMTFQPAVPTSTQEVAGLPWARLLRAAEALVMAQQRNSIQAWHDSARAAQIAVGSSDRPRIPRGRKPLGFDHYVKVARRYEQLCVEGGVAGNGKAAPVAQIAKEYDVNRNTARAWVNRARKKGLLGPASNGKAG